MMPSGGVTQRIALTEAADKGYIGIRKQLVAQWADLNLANERGRTPLTDSTRFGRTRMVCRLVERRVDHKATDDTGKTARDLARFQGNTDAETIVETAAKAAPPVVLEPTPAPRTGVPPRAGEGEGCQSPSRGAVGRADG